MKALELESGRVISLKQITINETYAGHMEGTWESVSVRILDRLAPEAESRPLHVVEASIPLPHFQCRGYFCSDAIEVGDNTLSSDLTVVWYVDRVPDSLGRLLAPLRSLIDWDGLAREFDQDDF